ncbi:MAG: ATP-binding cassette domain-containing protein [Muribaculaceae bacterium]|nr:ATP-binding cassette domain-containing protein [Muribaculaceae bacterium]
MIEVNDVKFSYSKHQPPVFDHFSIRFESGKIYGLLGKNGSGKSTLLYLLAGLLKPAEGRVLYKDNDAARRRPSFLGDTFIVPEVFDTPDRSIVAHARELRRFYPHFDNEFLNFCIKEFEIDPKRSMIHMSMGQRKKAYVSLALATRPRLLLMDEPSNGFDIPSKSQFRKVIAAGAADDTTVIISTHQAHDIENLIDQIVIIDYNGLLINVPVSVVIERLTLCRQMFGESTDGALFVRPMLGGNIAIYPTREGIADSMPLDLETFFEAVSMNPVMFTKYLNEKPVENGNV